MATAAVDTGSIVRPGAYDPISKAIAAMLTPATKQTVTTAEQSTADTEALRKLLAQLQDASTPAGSASLVKEIFARGTAGALPGVNAAVAATGARAGSSSYQALATNDMNARLAGAAAIELNRNVQSATQAAQVLAQSTQSRTLTQTHVTGVEKSLSDLLLPIGLTVGKNILTDLIKAPTKEAAKKVAATAGAVGSSTSAATTMQDYLGGSNAGFYDPTGALAGLEQGGSITDFVVNRAIGSAPSSNSYVMPSGGSFSGAAGNFGLDVALNEFLGGGTNSDTLGAAGTNALLSMIPGVGPVIAAGQILGIKEINEPVAALSDAAGGIVKGVGDVVSGAWDSISNFFGW